MAWLGSNIRSMSVAFYAYYTLSRQLSEGSNKTLISIQTLIFIFDLLFSQNWLNKLEACNRAKIKFLYHFREWPSVSGIAIQSMHSEVELIMLYAHGYVCNLYRFIFSDLQQIIVTLRNSYANANDIMMKSAMITIAVTITLCMLIWIWIKIALSYRLRKRTNVGNTPIIVSLRI